MKVFYFGCVGEYGHYMFEPPGVKRDAFTHTNPWGTKVDGGLCPTGGSTQEQGRALVHHKDGWTAMAFWDRSVDHRPGSCSVFLAQGTHAFEEMLRIANESFPKVTARYEFSITDGSK